MPDTNRRSGRPMNRGGSNCKKRLQLCQSGVRDRPVDRSCRQQKQALR